MRKLLKRIEAALAAAAFAEEGEVETARRLIAEASRDEAARGTERPRPVLVPDPRRSASDRPKVARLP